MADVRERQNRPLEKSYPILFLDALRVNSHSVSFELSAVYLYLELPYFIRKILNALLILLRNFVDLLHGIVNLHRS